MHQRSTVGDEGSATRLRGTRSPVRLLVVALVLALTSVVLSVAPVLAPLDSRLGRAFVVRSDAAACFDEQGNPVTCPISLNASPLPKGHLVGEQELGLLWRDASSGGLASRAFEWATGGDTGSCDPAAAACRLSSEARVGPASNGAQVPSAGHEVATAALDRSAPGGDADIVAGDFDGNGQQEQVTAANCGAGDAEICLSLYDPTRNTQTPLTPTGLYADTVGTGTVRLASGMLLRSTATITHVSFRVNDEGGGLIARFTTDLPHGFVEGQPIRFDDPGTLGAALCPSLQAGIDCASDIGIDWRPVASVVDATTFEVQIGEAFAGPESVDEGDSPHIVIPPDWPSGAILGTLAASSAEGAEKLSVVETADTPPAAPFPVSVNGEPLDVVDRTASSGSSEATYALASPATTAHPVGATVVGSGCDPCTTTVTGLTPGLAMAWDAPNHAGKLAVFRVTPGARTWAELVDDRDIAALPCLGTPGECRDPLDVTAGDFDGDGQEEMAVAFGAPGSVRFFAMADAKQLVALGGARVVEPDSRLPGPAYSFSIASGSLVQTEASNLDGEDLVFAWGSGGASSWGHHVVVADVGSDFSLRPATIDASQPGPLAGAWGMSPDGSLPAPITYAPGSVVTAGIGGGPPFWWYTPGGGTSCGSACTDNDGEAGIDIRDDTGIIDWQPFVPGSDLAVWDGSGTSAGMARNSSVRVEVADLDADGLDEVVVADTRPGAFPSPASAIHVQVWRSDLPTCTADLVTPAISAACPGPDEAPLKPVWQTVVDTAVDGGAAAVGPSGAGQLALAVGRLGRPKTTSSDLSYPNQLNPDIVVSWTCDHAVAAGSCGTPAAPGGLTAGVAVEPLAVHAPDTTSTKWLIEGNRGATIVAAQLPTNPDQVSVRWARTALTLPDIDADSVTLGTPTDYLRTGMVRPLMVLRSPPVHFDAFDRNGDGRTSPQETFDINNCFVDYLATGDSYVCQTDTKYGVSTTTTSTIGGEVKNSFEIGAEAFVGGGFGLGADGIGQVSLEAKLTARVKGGFDKTQKGESGQTFSYESTVSTSGGTDAVYAAVVTEEILEYPIYQGAMMGFSSNDPVGYATSVSQPTTTFKWTSSEDLGIPQSSNGLVGSNVLTYSRTADQLDAKPVDIQSASQKGTAVTVTTSGDHGFGCVQDNSEAGDLSGSGLDSLDKYPCAGGSTPVEIRGGSGLTGSYTVSRILKADQLLLAAPNSRTLNCDSGCYGSSVVRTPGRFPSDVWTVRRNHRLETQLQTGQTSGYEGSLSWFFSAGLTGEVTGQGTLGDKEGTYNSGSFGFTLDADYTHNEAQTMALQVGSDTTFGVTISGDIKPNVAYDVRPYLTQQVDGAMLLDWTAVPNSLDTFWQKYYVEPGPDPAFALPDLLTPYRTPYPNSQPDATVPLLLRSPDFRQWRCANATGTAAGSGKICTPVPSAPTDKPLTVAATIHNYSLKAFDGSRALKVRFFLGDPARGGYQIGEATVNSVRSPKCVNRWCLPAQQDSLARLSWKWMREAPGLTGRGRPTSPLPIYAVIDPANQVAEVHDWSTPVEVDACAADYPTVPGGSDLSDADYNSICPTTNNEAWFLQQFDGTPAPRTNLSVRAGDLEQTADGKSLRVTVHASADTQRVDVQIYACAASAIGCTPATVTKGLLSAPVRIGSIPKRGSVTKKLPLDLPKGRWVVWAQVRAVDNWEPPGGGPFDLQGWLRDNQASITITR